ncbi:MAG TPA: hypothetical protein VML91_15555 [Burkholderiales bacterium]|nr:hypothetical protein [Burkholderiales bacterium]
MRVIPITKRLRRAIAAGAALFLLTAALDAGVGAQECPQQDPLAQKAKEEACRAAGGEWGKFGAIAHLCGIYSCVPRTGDGGKPCRNRSECEYLCIYRRGAAIGTEVTGECAAVRSAFGCTTQVDSARVVGTVCID